MSKIEYSIEICTKSLNKFGEELCGDCVEIVREKDYSIVVLADGLGSGVKANILGTLTAKIAATMLKKGATLGETVDTIVRTLPECSVRKMAYSTFTIAKIMNNGSVYMVEFDNPKFFLLRDGKLMETQKKKTLISGKIIYEQWFQMDEKDFLVFISDGVLYAGAGMSLNLGWQWEDVSEFLRSLSKKEKTAFSMVYQLLEVVDNLYKKMPGDDSTVVGIKLHAPKVLNLFVGPPTDRADDEELVKRILNAKGKVVVSGGTTANILSKYTGKELDPDLSTYTTEVPPVAYLEGVDLITEGVITLHKTIDLLKEYLHPMKDSGIFREIHEKNGASRLAKMIIEDCTVLNITLGMAVNTTHQNPDFPLDFSTKVKQVEELRDLAERLLKKVHIEYL